MASGAAALASSRQASQRAQNAQSSRVKYQGDTVKLLQQRHTLQSQRASQYGSLLRGDAAQQKYNQVRARTTDDLSQTSQAQFVKTSPFKAQSVYDLRPDLKPRQISYRELFR